MPGGNENTKLKRIQLSSHVDTKKSATLHCHVSIQIDLRYASFV